MYRYIFSLYCRISCVYDKYVFQLKLSFSSDTSALILACVSPRLINKSSMLRWFGFAESFGNIDSERPQIYYWSDILSHSIVTPANRQNYFSSLNMFIAHISHANKPTSRHFFDNVKVEMINKKQGREWNLQNRNDLFV